jgi:CRISPR system Cascade subunit CasA
VSGSLCWFDTCLIFGTRSGKRVEATPLDITHNADIDPIVGVIARHAYVDIGFRFLMRDILQIALAPADADAWAALVAHLPKPDELRQTLEPYRKAFILDDNRFPAMQVRPTSERLAEIGKQKPRGAQVAHEYGDDEEDGTKPISALLPDAPTDNVVKKNHDFFVKRDTVGAIGAGAILPVLYAHMVLFPPSGGGYFSLPHGIDSIKFAVTGDTLWRSIAANLLDRQHGSMSPGPWPAPCDRTVFPWLDPTLATLSLKRGHSQSRRLVRWSSIHPASIPMPRRYMLYEPSERRCDLTGALGMSFARYERWPNGLQYDSWDWWTPFAASVEALEWTGTNWTRRQAKPKARSAADDDEVSAEDAKSETAGTMFLKSRGPLRFDQWLELSLDNPPSPPAGGGTAKQWRRELRPPVVSAFAAREPLLAEEFGRASQRSALARRTGFRLEATSAVLDGKALGGFDQGSLPLWWARDKAAASVADSVRGILRASHSVASALESAANNAAKNLDKPPVLGRELHNGLLAALDARLGEATQAMFKAFAELADEDQARETVLALRSELVRFAGREALEVFDSNFPFVTIDQTAIRIVGARRKLERALSRIVGSETPHDPTVGAGGQTGVVAGDPNRQDRCRHPEKLACRGDPAGEPGRPSRLAQGRAGRGCVPGAGIWRARATPARRRIPVVDESRHPDGGRGGCGRRDRRRRPTIRGARGTVAERLC